jgi:Mn2+/Fe2+ NRAMP family transporter
MPGPVVMLVVVAVSAVVALAIAAWLLHQVARRAIDKSTPEGLPAVLVALGAMIDPLRLFLPWSGRRPAEARRDDEEGQP